MDARPETSPRIPAVVPLLALGFVAVAMGVARARGHYDPVGVLLVGLGVTAFLVGLLLPRRTVRADVALGVAWGGVAIFLVRDVGIQPVLYLRPGGDTALPTWLFAAAAMVAGATWARLPPRARWLRAAVMLAIYAVLGAWALDASPAPRIDVWEVHQGGARLLLDGQPVYGNLHVADTARPRTITAYPYPPMNLYLTTLGFLPTGESRWAQLLCQLLGGGVLWWAARRRCGEDERLPDLLLALFLFHPRGLYTLEQAWSEPLGVPLLFGVVALYQRERLTAAAVMLGLLAAAKQQYVLYVPFVLLLPGMRPKHLFIAAAAGAATFLPFVGNPAVLWHDLVAVHAEVPPRADALSLSAHLVFHAGWNFPMWLGPAGALLCLLVAPWFRRVPGSPLAFATLAYALFFYVGRNAFCNYYYQVGATALAALVLALPAAVRTDASPPPPAEPVPGQV